MENNSDKTRKPSTRLSKASNTSIEIGRIPPQAVELEKAVLGALMLEKNAVTDIIDILKEESFYDPKHQYIYGPDVLFC